jgi:hypothetical protein
MTVFDSLWSACHDLNAGNPFGTKPICSQTSCHKCVECSDCKIGDALLRMLLWKL